MPITEAAWGQGGYHGHHQRNMRAVYQELGKSETKKRKQGCLFIISLFSRYMHLSVKILFLEQNGVVVSY